MLANGGWDLIRAPTNASKWRMEFNSAFEGLTRDPKVPNCVQRGLSLVLIPRQINPFNNFTLYSFNVHFNIIVSYSCVTKGVSTLSVFPLKFSLQFLTPKCVFYAQPSSLPSFEEPSRIQRRINIMVSQGILS